MMGRASFWITPGDLVFGKLLGTDALSLRRCFWKTPETSGLHEAVVGLLELRRVVVVMDTVVAESYRREDIALRHDFYEVDYLHGNDRVRYMIQPEAGREVLKRMLALNHAIHAKEVEAVRLWDKMFGGALK